MNKAVFAGSFDPFTLGHFDIVSRAARFFDKIVVGVAGSTSGKNCKLPLDKRLELTEKSLKDFKNIQVLPFDNFLVDFARNNGASTIIRGLRTSNDFEYEKALSEVYRSQNSELEIFYLISSHFYCHISSTIVRELAIMGGSMQGYVHKNIEECVVDYYKRGNI